MSHTGLLTCSLAVAEQRGAAERPVLGRLDAAQTHREDVVQVCAARLFVNGTGVKAEAAFTVGHVGADGVNVHHGQRSEQHLKHHGKHSL